MTLEYVYGLHAGDGWIRYVGRTKNPKRRLSEHRSPATQAKTRARGSSIKFMDWLSSVRAEITLLDVCSTPEEADRREVYWTTLLPDLLNRSVGKVPPSGAESAWHGRKHTDEWRRANSERMTGSGHHFYGKKLSDEHRAKLGQPGVSNPNAGFTEEQVRNIRQAYQEGDMSIRDLARQEDVNYSTIQRMVRRITYSGVS